MNKKIIGMAAVLAALAVLAVILGITAFYPREDEKRAITIYSKPTATPEGTASHTDVPEGTPTPEPTEEMEEAPVPTKMPASALQSSAAFTLKIKNRTVSVAYGVEKSTLDKTPGWLTTSAAPGDDGMCVVYGHRNRTHLRALEKVEHGDPITVSMPDGTVYTYTVMSIQIYENMADILLPTVDGKTLVLVTCYPFRYSGTAPQKTMIVAKIKMD